MHEDPIVGIRSTAIAREFQATIRPREQPFRVREAHPLFEVRIRNLATNPALLVLAADGSEWESSPGHRIEVNGPPGGFHRVGRKCGSKNGVGRAHFVVVEPGGEFNPFVHAREGCGSLFGGLLVPGHYTATFRYVTTEPSARLWMGLEAHGGIEEVRDLLEAVAVLDLTATTAFEVVA